MFEYACHFTGEGMAVDDLDRETLFENEKFLIGILQASSGGAPLAGLAQLEPLLRLAGRLPVLIFLSAMGAALAASVLAAWLKHEYKMWDVKAHVSKAAGKNEEAARRFDKAGKRLHATRLSIKCSVALIVSGLAVVLVAFWTHPPVTSGVGF